MTNPLLYLLLTVPAALQAQTDAFPLKTAARAGSAVEVDSLLAKGAPLTQVDEAGNSALISAAYHGRPEVVALLLRRGADPDHRNQEGYAALDYAMERGHRAVAQALLKHWQQSAHSRKDLPQAGVLALLHAVTEPGSVPSLPPGAQLDQANASGYGALAMAVRWGSLPWVKALLAAGAKVNAPSRSRYDSTPLMEATRDGHLEMANTLLQAGAEVNQRDRHGDHALNWAAYFGHADLVQLLVDRGSRLDYTGQSPENALQIATREKHARVIEILQRAAEQARRSAKPTSSSPSS
jgi:ankyrin repeat protein